MKIYCNYQFKIRVIMDSQQMSEWPDTRASILRPRDSHVKSILPPLSSMSTTTTLAST